MRLLRNVADLVAEGGPLPIRDTRAVDHIGSTFHRQQARHELQERRLATGDRADNGNGSARRYVHRHVLERGREVARISESHAVERHSIDRGGPSVAGSLDTTTTRDFLVPQHLLLAANGHEGLAPGDEQVR